MAKSGSSRKAKRGTKGIGRFRVVMTDRIRLMLAACFIVGFLIVGYIILTM